MCLPTAASDTTSALAIAPCAFWTGLSVALCGAAAASRRAGISLANTLVMAAADRRHDLTALRLAGATAALHLVSAPATLVVPWQALGRTTTACAVLALTAALAPAGAALRSPARP